MNQSDNKISKIFFIISATTFVIAFILLIVGQKDSIKHITFTESLNLRSEKLRIVELYNSFNPLNKEFSEAINSDTSLQNYISSNFEYIKIKTSDKKEFQSFQKYYGESNPGLLLVFDKHLRPMSFLFPSSDSKSIKLMLMEIQKMKYIFDVEIEMALEQSKSNGKLTLLLISKHLNDSYGLYDFISKDAVKPFIEQNFNLTLLGEFYDKDNAKIKELANQYNLSEKISKSDFGVLVILDANKNLISIIEDNSEIYDKTGDKLIGKLQDAVRISLENAK